MGRNILIGWVWGSAATSILISAAAVVTNNPIELLGAVLWIAVALIAAGLCRITRDG